MTVPLVFTDEEAALLADAQFFRKKERISAKVRALLDALGGRAGIGTVAGPDLGREPFRSMPPIVTA